jgi:phytoene dehydrogenase-like protein/NAD-dependent dihydropyrimidine dehydrogenase PreA subunit
MRVQKERCTGCGYCLLTCPEGAISSDGWAVIDEAKCTDCNLCLSVCPNDALVAAMPVEVAKPQLRGRYDAVIVGAGIGGLMAGAALAKEGWRVALFEKLSFLGGRYTELDYDGYRVTTAAWTSLGDKCNIGCFLEELGASVRYISLKDRGCTQQSTIRFRDGRGYPTLEAILPPGERRAFLRAIAKGRREDLRRINTSDYMKRYIQNEDFLAAIDSLVSTASGVKMEAFPASEFIQIMVDVIAAGSDFAFPTGGTCSLIQALVQIIEEHEGEIHYPAEVSDIWIEDGEAVGVALEGRTLVRAEVVVHNAGARRLVRLVGREGLPPGYVERIEGLLPMDCGALILGTKEPLYTQAPMLLTPRCDRVVGIFAPTFFDPSVAPLGKHMVDVFFPIYSADRRKELELAWGDLHALFPHLEEALDIAIPMLFVGGWTGAESAQTFGQVGDQRLDPRTPVENLYLVGMDAVGSGAAGDLIPIGVRRLLEYLL